MCCYLGVSCIFILTRNVWERPTKDTTSSTYKSSHDRWTLLSVVCRCLRPQSNTVLRAPARITKTYLVSRITKCGSTKQMVKSTRGQLKRVYFCFPSGPCLRLVFGLARDWFGRPIPRQPADSPHSGYIRCFLPLIAIGSVLILSCHAILRTNTGV